MKSVERMSAVRPMPLRVSIACFALPSAALLLTTRVGIPLFREVGLSWLTAFGLALGVPLLGLLVASVVAYRREGNAWTSAAVRKRFRLQRMSRADWVWTLGLLGWTALSSFGLSFTSRWLANLPLFAPPDWVPGAADPRLKVAGPSGLLAASGWMYLSAAVFWLIDVAGEELWWRGYILPRQELAHRKHAWLVHGLLWTGFHIFFPWNLLSILPIALALSYVAQARQSTWPGVIVHAIATAAGTLSTVAGLAAAA